MAISAENRPIKIVIGSMDADRVLLTGFQGREAISELFHFNLELAVESDKPLDFAQVLGQPTIVTLQMGNAVPRKVMGIISKLRQVRKAERLIHYTAEFVPPLWRRSIDSDSDVFQQVTTKAIIETVLKPLVAAQDHTFKLAKTYFPRNFCVRYRESTVDFISRLMEDEGIWYFYDHGGNKPELVFADGAQGRRKLPDGDTLEFRELTMNSSEADLIGEWTKSQSLTATSVVFVDHHFLKPRERFNAVDIPKGTVQVGKVSHASNPDPMRAPLLDCPGGFAHWRDDVAQNGAERNDFPNIFDDSRRLQQVEAERVQALEFVIEGTSTVARLCPGFVFTLEGHFDGDGDYLLTSVEHTAKCGASENGSPVGPTYTNTFTCIPAALEFKPQYETVKPFIAGTQTALVTGTNGEEIEPDEFGRVKVQFRWDNRPFTEKKSMELESSCWVRVAQQWAGRKFGFQFIPRIGDEVLVAFEEGDPDKPIIIGSVYNAENEPTYDLPANKTQSGIKTRSSPQGTPANFNELKFEDKKGAEFVSIHAEKDMFTHVENLHTISVGSTASSSGSDTKTTGTLSTQVYGDTSLTVTKGDYSEHIQAGTSTTEVKGKVKETYHADQETNVDGKVWENYHNELETAVDSNVFLRSGATIRAEANGGDFFVFGHGLVEVKAAGSNVNISAPTEIKLTVGGSSISITTDTITISAANIKLNGKKTIVQGSSEATLEGNKVTVSGSTTDVKATGKTTIGGSPVNVNC